MEWCILGLCILGLSTLGLCSVGLCTLGPCSVGLCTLRLCMVGLNPMMAVVGKLTSHGTQPRRQTYASVMSHY